MRLLGLFAVAVLAAGAFGVGHAAAAPDATTVPGSTPTPGTAPAVPRGVGVPETGIAQLDKILNALADAGSSRSNSEQSSQMVVVTAPSASDQTASLTAFERETSGTWKPVFGPTKAFLGELGMGEPQDNVPRTPEGTFALDQAFGRLANPGTTMPYFTTSTQDWWDSDMTSPTYNTHVHQAASPGGDSENLYNAGAAYDYAINIAHNPARIPGKASAIFLHASTGQPTEGCVSIDREILREVLMWLKPAKHPRITIGVNQLPPSGTARETTPETGTAQTAPGASPRTSPDTTASGDSLRQLLNQLVGIVSSILGGAR